VPHAHQLDAELRATQAEALAEAQAARHESGRNRVEAAAVREAVKQQQEQLQGQLQARDP
jgi:hypothetical protein